MSQATLNRTIDEHPRLRWRPALALVVMGCGVAVACSRTRTVETSSQVTPAHDAGTSVVGSPAADGSAGKSAELDGSLPPEVTVWSPPPASAIDGPHERLTLDAGRPVYYASAAGGTQPFRLVAHLHGMCGPPSYACGKWIGAGTEVGIMVCPTGNARCGDSPYSPPSWEAPTWTELVGAMDADLEAAVAKVEKKLPGAVRREGAILTGYSRGAYAAPAIARRHPKRWPYLVLIEANIPLSIENLEKSGVRAVALVAGELGNEIAGMQKTQRDLESAGFPAKLFVMRRTGHPYSDDMEYVMHDALTYVLEREHDGH